MTIVVTKGDGLIRPPIGPDQLESGWILAVTPSYGVKTKFNATLSADSVGPCYVSSSTGFQVTVDPKKSITSASYPWTLLVYADIQTDSQGLIANRAGGDGWTFCVYSNKVQFYSSNSSAFVTGTLPAWTPGLNTFIITTQGGNTGSIYYNGVEYQIAGLSGLTQSPTTTELELLTWDSGLHVSAGNKLYLAAVASKTISPSEAKILTNNPWKIFRSTNKSIFFTATSATHAATGALVGTGSSISGSAERQPPGTVSHDATGALSGQGSTIAGAASRVHVFSASGGLVGQGSAISGTAVHNVPHLSSGGLVGQGSTIAGAATRTAASVSHDATGALVGTGSTISGTATNSGASTLTPQDLLNIADAVWAHSSAVHCQLLLTEVWGRLGLDPSAPLTSGTTQITFGSIVMAMTEAAGSVTVTRQ